MKDKNWMLSSKNAILALGHIAVTLRESEDHTKSVLKFLLQWFDSNASSDHDYDPLILDQLGCIAISRVRNDIIYTEVMKKFKVRKRPKDECPSKANIYVPVDSLILALLGLRRA